MQIPISNDNNVPDSDQQGMKTSQIPIGKRRIKVPNFRFLIGRYGMKCDIQKNV